MPSRSDLNANQRRTLEKIFSRDQSLRWNEVESLMRALGAEVDDSRSGSRVSFTLKGRPQVFHRPHPNPQLSRSMKRAVRDFLEAAGETP
jgi:hypothetical protein